LEGVIRQTTADGQAFSSVIAASLMVAVVVRTKTTASEQYFRPTNLAMRVEEASSLGKNAVVAFVPLAKLAAKLLAARKIATCVAILRSHPAINAAR